jgi:hypothetical protein
MTLPRRRSEDRNGKWHFTRTFSVDSIIQIVGMAVVVGGPILLWGQAIQNRVLTLENFNQAAAANETKRDQDTREQRQSFNSRMDKVEERLNELRVLSAQVLAGQQTVPRPSPSVRR